MAADGRGIDAVSIDVVLCKVFIEANTFDDDAVNLLACLR